MKTIGIITNADKDIDFKYTRILLDSIKNMGGKALISSDIPKGLDLKHSDLTDEEVLNNSEALICLGGDGTFLKLARRVYTKNIPLLGINMGSLGFLTEVERHDIKDAVGQLIRNDFEIESRMMIEVNIIRNGEIVAKDTALNDIVISRGALSRILHLKMHINDAFADLFPGDGLIVSTPTGSTGYSLSAGGPIVEPNIDLIIVTPICPHILYSRSLITTGSAVVKIIIDEEYCHTAMVTVDGQEGYEVVRGDTIVIKKAEYCTKMIRINSRNFFNVLRTKIYERGENLIKNEV